MPTIVTVHDLAVLRHPEVFPAWTRLYGRTALRPTLRAADRVFAVSEFSKRETVELAGVDPERIDVVPNALEPVFRPEGDAAEGDYVLAVGTLEPRKNLARVVEATARAGVELRLVGAAGWGDAGGAGKHVTWLGRIDDEELAAAYRGARCLVFPSLYEGFGIPALEAMACGTPVVTSAGSAMAEVTGDAAVLVDPLDVASIAAGIEVADRRRDELVPLGLERAARVHLGADGRGRRRGLPEGARMTAPLVVVDADVLGRRRTGDETYVRNLLRELGALAPDDLRVAAATRHPELVPDGIEPLELRTPVQELRMLATLPRLLRRTRRGARAHAVRRPARRALPGGRHDPRSLARARRRAHGPARTGSSSAASSRGPHAGPAAC